MEHVPHHLKMEHLTHHLHNDNQPLLRSMDGVCVCARERACVGAWVRVYLYVGVYLYVCVCLQAPP